MPEYSKAIRDFFCTPASSTAQSPHPFRTFSVGRMCTGIAILSLAMLIRQELANYLSRYPTPIPFDERICQCAKSLKRRACL